jgi:amino acid transporter
MKEKGLTAEVSAAVTNGVGALAPEVFADKGQMRREIGLSSLTLISLGSIIGSGWLLGALTAATAAGPASIVSWIIGGAILAVLALVHAELGGAYPLSGGTARFPFISFGAIGGFTGAWMSWIQAVTIAPIEVEASLTYLQATPLHPGFIGSNGQLTATGFPVAALAMAAFTYLNVLGVRRLAESNSIATIWKLVIPTGTVVVLVIASFHASNFSAGGGFAPFGVHGIFAALPLGVVFAASGFEQAIQVGGEARNPQRDIHRAVLFSMIIGIGIYILLQVAFIGAVSPHAVAHNWDNPIPGVGAFGPFASVATAAGVGWLATILYIDAVISPAGCGLVYTGTSARISYALSRNGYLPAPAGRLSKRGVPLISLLVCWVVGMLVMLPFPSWAGLVSLVSAATILMYAPAPVCLAALRRQDPSRPRPYRLPAAKVLAPGSFVCANLIAYWSGWNTIFWLYALIVIGYLIFFIHRALAPADKRVRLHWRAAAWVVPWLIGLAVISYLGQYPNSAPSSGWPFGVPLLAKQTIPQWWDLATVAVFSIIIYYIAVASALPAGAAKDALDAADDDVDLAVEPSKPL